MAGKNDRVLIAIVTLLFGYLVSSSAEAQQSETPAATGVSQEKLSQNFRAQHEIGHRFQIDPNDLPAPKAGAIVTNRSLIVPYDGQVPQVPPGFTATPLVTGLAHPRRLLVFPNGDILVAEQKAGYLTLLRDDGSGRAQWIERHVEDLDRPYGLAWRDGNVLVADQNGIWSVPQVLGALRAGRSETLRIDQVPPQERRPVAGAYGAKMITQKAYSASFRVIRTGRWQSIRKAARFLSALVPPATWASNPNRRRRSSRSMRTAARKRRSRPACAIRRRWHFSRRPASSMRWCRSATASAMDCQRTS